MVLISAILLITLLCGCRTRISNNTNVGRRLTDVDGTVQELYETRRDELGIPVAEAPLFPSKGSDEEYEGNGIMMKKTKNLKKTKKQTRKMKN